MINCKNKNFSLVGFKQKAFTLLEVVIVILIVGLLAVLVLRPQLGNYRYWEHEGAIRKLSELVTFLYYQAMTDGSNYRLEFNLHTERPFYKIGQLVNEQSIDNTDANEIFESGTLLSQEIEHFLHPTAATYSYMIEPENIPSLAEPIYLPEGLYIEDIRTMRGVYNSSSDEDKPYIIFSPRGFSEFAVIHLRQERDSDQYITILINPFTGLTTIYRDYRDFEWTYDNRNER